MSNFAAIVKKIFLFLNPLANEVDLFRSEEMQLLQLIVPNEAAHDTVNFLGEIGLLQFKDLNEDKLAFKRTFVNQVRRSEDQCRMLRFFKEQTVNSDVQIQVAAPTLPDQQLSFDELEARLHDYEQELLHINANNDTLNRKFAELQEYKIVLEKASQFLDHAPHSLTSSNGMQNQNSRGGREIEMSKSTSMNANQGIQGSASGMSPMMLEKSLAAPIDNISWTNIAGLIEKTHTYQFETMLWKATRGNLYLQQENIGKVMDPNTGEEQDKNVFVVFFSGERARQKINRICESFSCTRYYLPDDRVRRQQVYQETSQQILEMKNTIEAGNRLRFNLLNQIASEWGNWEMYVKRQKAIYYTLNKFSLDVSHQCLIGEAWCPTAAVESVKEAANKGSQKAAGVETIVTTLWVSEQPPTYFKTNKLTKSFQGLVSSYGIANYREVNPTVYTLVTFPFLFAVMFGDIGHGIILLLVGLAFAAFERVLSKKKLNDLIEMPFGGRYLLIAMGVFSIYVGILYNEFFSIPGAFFGGTKYQCPGKPGIDYRNQTECPEAFDIIKGGLEFKSPGSPYPFGFDPIWHGTLTELPFFNGIKMKIAIILGIIQMNLGIWLSLYNHLYFKDYVSILFEFIPEILFLNCLFGYLSILIIYKWVGWPYLEARSKSFSTANPQIGRPADLYGVLINMFLKPGRLSCEGLCTENNMYNGQAWFQVALILICLICIPWMLIPKPLILRHRHKKRQQAGDMGYGLLRNTSAHSQEHVKSDEYNNNSESAFNNADAYRELSQDGTNNDEYKKRSYNNSAQLKDVLLNLDKDALQKERTANGHSGGGHHGAEFDFSEIFVHQLIHTIEFVLGAISNTASYLRLWALSLAHSQLSAVFFEKVVLLSLQPGTPTIILFVGTAVWFAATLIVLMIMESLSAFLHALRLHWVEFQNKFYKGEGVKFVPFSFQQVDEEEI